MYLFRSNIAVNGELINHCTHDEAINIIHNAGDMVMLTVKHYASATPFLAKTSKYRPTDSRSFSSSDDAFPLNIAKISTVP
jgi:hypothetical protein